MCMLPECNCKRKRCETAQKRANLTAPPSKNEQRECRKRECQSRGRSRTNSNPMISNIIHSASKGDLSALNMYWSHGWDLSQADYDGRSPLHLAVAEKHLEVVRFLLETCRVPHDKTDRWGKPPLSIAEEAMEKDISDEKKEKNNKIIEYLRNYDQRLKEGGFLERKFEASRVPVGHLLCNAAYEGDLEAVKEYVERGYDPTEADYDGRTALHLACSEGREDIVQYLLEKRSECYKPVDRNGSTPLNDAESYGHVAIVKMLKDHMYKCEAQEVEQAEKNAVCKSREKIQLTNKLNEAVGCDDLEACEDVLHEADRVEVAEEICLATEYQQGEWRKCLDKNDQEQDICDAKKYVTPLLKIAKAPKNGLKILKLFLTYNLHMAPALKSEFLEECIRNKKHDILEFFLQETALDPNVTGQRGSLPLYTAMVMGDVTAVKLLLSHGADPKSTENQYRQCPHNFCIRSQVKADVAIEILEELKQHGANPAASCYHGFTPVHLAIGVPRTVSETKSLLTYLFANDAQVNGVDLSGQTPLQNASGDASYRPNIKLDGNDRLKLVEFLIDEGAEIDHCSNDGSTALHAAAKGDHHQIVQVLIKNGADFRLRNIAKFTAADLAPPASKSKALLLDAMATDFQPAPMREVGDLPYKKKKRKRKRRKSCVENSGNWPMEHGLERNIVQQRSQREPIEHNENSNSASDYKLDNRHIMRDLDNILYKCKNYDPCDIRHLGTKANRLTKEERMRMGKEEKKTVEKACTFLSTRLGNSYKTVLRYLYKGRSLSETEAMLDGLCEIQNDLHEKCFQGLRAWQVWKGYSARVEDITQALVACELWTLLSEFKERFPSQ